MRLTMLGTGHAVVTECYNTCFVLEDESRPVPERYFLVDGGGGSGLITQLAHAGIPLTDVRQMFVTHKHLDHLLGMVWMMRLVCQLGAHGAYPGEAYLYAHDEVIGVLWHMAHDLLTPEEEAVIGRQLHLVEVRDGETRAINGCPVTFFDIGSTKAKQFGFSMEYGAEREEGREGAGTRPKRLVCCGDEPASPRGEEFAQGADWLLHEAFCLHEQADVFRPYEKHHSTVKDACELAERLGVQNLVLYHTEDGDLAHRKELYRAEGARYYHGNLYVPDDLERLELG